MSEITASEQIRLDIIKKVNYDTAAAKLAIDWVGDSYLKSELFADSFDRVFTESEIVSKTRKAIHCLILPLRRSAKALQQAFIECL
ncbi:MULTISPECIES: DUF2560 family protein [Klebsiella pneumoniae complex]|uniref:DUF2560 family protein n=1 Tax=Klebsiella pneumoniae complex TaxID=3390273 RepID=UPI000A5FE64B|nr:DUF2560 family protein [Klebsiella pneumoniae]MCP5666302.1 DUF2560 family protein [Klebsiella pneumoniae]MCP5722760.1 DUF2560 family protein [Klebsiella pneumoniae]MCP6689032.1 DUF2560 family protein [Klebsiella pneumoniae]MCQ0644250.1 DUF2560 family protein [Klebsiella pneumoniae]MCQ0789681.1 DUF2560 family protein [Klebsiella pneumoniae]